MKMGERKPGPAKEKSASAPVKEETRERLLDAAEKVFVEFGFYDATVREICKRAQVNLALVNYHFGDKAQLYIEVFGRAMHTSSKVEMQKRANDPNVDPLTLVRDVVAESLGQKKKKNVFEVLMQQESLQPTPAMEFIIEKFMRPSYEALCTVIGRILKLPGSHETTRLVTHSVIAQTKYFSEPERLLSRLDPKILSHKSDEELADFIVSFSLAGPYMRGLTDEATKLQGAESMRKTKLEKAGSSN
jgi:AcrR family transcriptional regulator